jgi:hypothetical protein
MKKVKKEIFTVIVENQINEKEVYAEIKTKFGNMAPTVSALNKSFPSLVFEYVNKSYFLANKEHYKNVKK